MNRNEYLKQNEYKCLSTVRLLSFGQNTLFFFRCESFKCLFFLLSLLATTVRMIFLLYYLFQDFVLFTSKEHEIIISHVAMMLIFSFISLSLSLVFSIIFPLPLSLSMDFLSILCATFVCALVFALNVI